MNQFDEMRFVYLLVLLIAIGSVFFTTRRHSSAPVFQYAIAWVGIFVVLIIVYSFKERLYQQLFPSSVSVEGDVLSVGKSMDGHYYMDLIVNGENVKFMVDTGASDVVLTYSDAMRLGIKKSELKNDRVYNTANGQISASSIVLESIVIGDFEFKNVKASVSSAEMGISLLGMSLLERFDYYKFDNNKLIIKY